METEPQQQHSNEENFPIGKIYTIQYLRMFFCSLTLITVVASSLESHLPSSLRRLWRYGKFGYNGKADFVRSFEVPKSWFRFFYVYTAPLTICTFALAVRVYVFDAVPPGWLLKLLENDGAVRRSIAVNPVNVLLAITLLTLQIIRRLYDTHFISVFGKNARLNIWHCILAIAHYTAIIPAILCEAPIFASNDSAKTDLFDLRFRDILAVGLFFIAWVHQYKVNVILANLRKNSKGRVVSEEYKVPQGDWFKYVSSPHSTTEIMIYFAIAVILWSNLTFWFVFTWILANQVETILLSHWWYQETFKNFPVERKALIPFVY